MPIAYGEGWRGSLRESGHVFALRDDFHLDVSRSLLYSLAVFNRREGVMKTCDLREGDSTLLIRE